MRVNYWLIFLAVLIGIDAAAQKRYKQVIAEEIDSSKDVAYGKAMNIKGEEEVLLLDVFRPAHDSVQHRPLLIFIHGGGFQNNSGRRGTAGSEKLSSRLLHCKRGRFRWGSRPGFFFRKT